MAHGQFGLLAHAVFPRIRLSREVTHLYLISAVRTFLSSAVAIFLPLYFMIYVSPSVALIYYTVSYLLMSFFITLIIFLRERVSFEWLGLISTVAFVVLFAYVYSVPPSLTTALVAAVFYGISGGLYWLPHHLVYTLYGKKNVSSEYGGEAIVNDIVSMLSPIVSGAVAYFLSFHVFFALVSVVSIFYLLVWVTRLHHKTLLDFTPLRRFYKHIKIDRAALYFIGGIITIPTGAYGLYVYSTGYNTASLGLVIGISFLIDAILAYFVSRYVDESHDYPIAAMGFLLMGFIFLHMLYTPWLAGVLVLLFGFVRRISYLPSMTWVYLIARRSNGAELYVREVFLILGRIVYLGTILLLGGNVLATTMLIGTYGLIFFGVFFYYLARIRYPEVEG